MNYRGKGSRTKIKTNQIPIKKRDPQQRAKSAQQYCDRFKTAV